MGRIRAAFLVGMAALLPACGDDGDTIIVQGGAAAPASGTLLALVPMGANNVLVNVSAAAPDTVIRSVLVTGAGGTLYALDYRPADSRL